MDLKYQNKSNAAKEMKSCDWLKEPQFYIVGLIYMLSRLIDALFMAYIVYYVEFTLLLGKENNATIPLVMYVSGFIMCFILRVIKKRCSINLIFSLSCVFGIGKNANCKISFVLENISSNFEIL